MLRIINQAMGDFACSPRLRLVEAGGFGLKADQVFAKTSNGARGLILRLF